MEQIAYKFVDWDVPALDTLKNESVYKMRVKVLEGKPLSRKEKNELQRMLEHNSYSKQRVPLRGWMFDFSSVLRVFYVEQYGNTYKVFATDKTAIRSTWYGRITSISEKL